MSKMSRAQRRAAHQRTRAQAKAASINGAKSQGPVTAEGKAVSSRNAVKHGLSSAVVTLNEEEIRTAEGIRYGYVRRYQPQDQLELEIVEGLVLCEIKLRRLDRLELEAMERAFSSHDTNEPGDEEHAKKYPSLATPSLATLGRYRGRLNHERRQAEERLMILMNHRPRAEGPVGIGAKQHRFMAEMIERAEQEQARLLAGRGADVGTAQSLGWDVIPEVPTPAAASSNPPVTNEPSSPANAPDPLADAA